MEIRRFKAILAGVAIVGLLGGVGTSYGAVGGHSEAEDIVIKTIMMEEANDYAGMVAVAEVIRNRANEDSYTHGHYLERCKQVCLRPYQFSSWNSKIRVKWWLERYGTGELYQKASKAWHEAQETNTTNGANHYHANTVNPKWAKSMIKTVRIGNHQFYREGTR